MAQRRPSKDQDDVADNEGDQCLRIYSVHFPSSSAMWLLRQVNASASIEQVVRDKSAGADRIIQQSPEPYDA